MNAQLPPLDHGPQPRRLRLLGFALDAIAVILVLVPLAIAVLCVPLTLAWLLSLLGEGEPSVGLRRAAAVVSAVSLLDGLLLFRGARGFADEVAEDARRRGLIRLRAVPGRKRLLNATVLRTAWACVALGVAGLLAAVAAG